MRFIKIFFFLMDVLTAKSNGKMTEIRSVDPYNHDIIIQYENNRHMDR